MLEEDANTRRYRGWARSDWELLEVHSFTFSLCYALEIQIRKQSCCPKELSVWGLRKVERFHSFSLTRKKMWFIYTMEYYSAMRKNEILPFATPWMELEGIMLSEISRSEKDRWFHSSVEFEKLNRRPWGKGRGRNSLKQRRRQTIRES